MRVRSRLAVRWGACAAAWWAAACNFDASGSGTGASLSVGDDGPDPTGADDVGSEGDDDSAGDGSQGSDASTTGVDVPDCTHDGGATCGAPAPAGWSGPFAIASMSPPDGSFLCPTGWNPQFWGYRDVQDVPATCGCDCAPSVGSCEIAVTYYADAQCTSASEGASSSGDCAGMSTADAHGYVRAVPTASGANCAASPTKTVPAVSWGEGSLFCSPPPAEACDDGPCLPPLPAGFADRWCVTADGEQACPAGDYAVPFLLYRSATDSRDCSGCSCTLDGAPVCPGSLTVYQDWFCALFSTGSVAIDGACHPAPSPDDNTWGVEYDGGPPTYGCTSSGSAPLGEVAPADPLTVCCTP
ncbi:MAG TPA: hypothetical protein VFG69_03565 [Nannocystaceae bacterium]|nr:hypothetical protein [Nannocystaceae bacterium]